MKRLKAARAALRPSPAASVRDVLPRGHPARTTASAGGRRPPLGHRGLVRILPVNAFPTRGQQLTIVGVVVVVDVSGGRWYGCARGKRAIVPKRGGPRRIGGWRFLLTRSIWTILGGRRSKVYHKVQHGGRLLFHGVCGF